MTYTKCPYCGMDLGDFLDLGTDSVCPHARITEWTIAPETIEAMDAASEAAETNAAKAAEEDLDAYLYVRDDEEVK